MRGRPLERMAAVVAAFFVLGLLVWRVTSPAPEPKAMAEGAVAGEPSQTTTRPEAYKIDVDFVHAPAGFKILFLGETIMEGKGPTLNFSREIKLPLPSQGLELVLEANWPEKTPLTAVRFQCEKNSDVITDRTFWGKRELTQVILVR